MDFFQKKTVVGCPPVATLVAGGVMFVPSTSGILLDKIPSFFRKNGGKTPWEWVWPYTLTSTLLIPLAPLSAHPFKIEHSQVQGGLY